MANPKDLTLVKRQEPFVATKIKISIYAVSDYSVKGNVDEFFDKLFETDVKGELDKLEQDWHEQEK